MGWTIDEYEASPAEFVDTIYAMLVEQANARKKADNDALIKNR